MDITAPGGMLCVWCCFNSLCAVLVIYVSTLWCCFISLCAMLVMYLHLGVVITLCVLCW